MKSNHSEKNSLGSVPEQDHQGLGTTSKPGGGGVPEKAGSEQDDEGVKNGNWRAQEKLLDRPGGGGVPEKVNSEQDDEGVKGGHRNIKEYGSRNVHIHIYI